MDVTENTKPVFTFCRDHYSIAVKSLDSSSDFYGRVLGLREIGNAGLGPKFKWHETDDGFQIHLIQREDHIGKLPKAGHLALNTSDLDGFIALLKTLNYPFENWSGEADTYNTRPDGVRQIYLQDPDEYWIEINDNGY